MRDEALPSAIPNLLTRFSTDLGPTTRSLLSWKNRVLRFGVVPTNKGWSGVPASLAIVGLITMVGYGVEPVVRASNLAVFYMLAVVFSALRWERRAVIVSAIASALLFNYFFVPPHRTFVMGDRLYLITLIGLLTVGLIISTLVVATREKVRASRRSESHIAALCALTQSLAEESKLDRIIDALDRHVLATFQRPIVVLLPDVSGLTGRTFKADWAYDEHENEASTYAFENDQEAGYGTDQFPDSTMHYLPLKAWQGVVGVVGVRAADWKEWHSGGRQQLLRSFMSQAALAVTRADLVSKAQQAEVLQEADKLQKALLNSVSHNLRTPIASIMGALNSVLEDGPLLDTPTQQILLRTAQEEAGKLNCLVQNLLDMTRLEGGAVRVKAEPCDLHDVVGAALHQLSEAALSRPVSIAIAPDLPLVPMDHVLIVQVLVNMLDNALKYSPRDAPIEIEARLNVGQLEIRVLDRGRGIPEQELTRVFDKFFRGSLPGAPRGAGLGLSICKGFVEAHNGRILAKSRTHGGTELAFYLPLKATRE